jgi:hypothetical protein
VALSFFAQVTGGQTAQFAIHKAREVIKGLLVSFGPFRQQERHFVSVRHSYEVEHDQPLSCAEYTPFRDSLRTSAACFREKKDKKP